MFSRKKGYKIRVKIHGKGGIFSTSRLAYVPLLDWTAVTGDIVKRSPKWGQSKGYSKDLV